MNKTTNLPKTHHPFTDKYFLRTAEILRYDNVNPYVKMQVFVRKGPGEIRGLEEAVEILEKYSNLRKNGGHVLTLPEGFHYEPGEVVMTIEGFLQDFVELETMYLGVISAATTLANGGVEPTYESVHKRAKELVEAANSKPCLYFGARHWHYSLDEMITKAALDAGFVGSSTDVGAQTHDLEGSGTIPHALVLAYGSTIDAAKSFDKYIDKKVPRIVLIDTFNREISDTLATCYALGDRLAGIRIDTCGENICEKGTEHNGHVEVINKLSETLDEVIIGIGSSNKSNTPENPFTADERQIMLELALKGVNYRIIRVPDVNNYNAWTDMVIELAKPFDVVFTGNAVVKRLFEKKNYQTRELQTLPYLSASQVRKMLVDGETCDQYLPEGTLKVLKEIKGVERLKRIYNHAEHNNPLTAVDMIIEYYNPEFEGIVLIKRKEEPFKDKWALPGGFQEYKHSFEKTALKETNEETNLSITLLHQLRARSDPGRDPRGHVNSIPYVVRGTGELKAGDDAAEAKIFPLNNLPPLAFDHKEIIEEYLSWKEEQKLFEEFLEWRKNNERT